MRCPYCGDRRTEVLKTVYRGSVPKRGQYVGAALSGSGRGPAHCERDGGIDERRLCGGSVR